jgi:hypothetical protein
MALRPFLFAYFSLNACAAFAEAPALLSLLPNGATVLSSSRAELDGRAPEETILSYRYNTDGEASEGVVLYNASCGILWSSEESLSANIAPSWETKDLTGDGIDEFIVSQPVHAGQEAWVHVYRVDHCETVELINEFIRPAEPLSLRRDKIGPLVSFTFRGYETCLRGGGEEDGYVKTFRPTPSGFILVESRAYQKTYPFFPPVRSGGTEAARVASWFIGKTELYDHISADLDGDGEKELIFLYDAGKGGGLLVVTRDKTKHLWRAMLQSSFGFGPLSLEGYVRAISTAELTGEGGNELIIDASAELGCKLETFVLRFDASRGAEVLLDTRRSFKDPVRFSKKTLSYRETERGLPLRWSWDGSAFVSSSGEISLPRLLPSSGKP